MVLDPLGAGPTVHVTSSPATIHDGSGATPKSSLRDILNGNTVVLVLMLMVRVEVSPTKLEPNCADRTKLGVAMVRRKMNRVMFLIFIYMFIINSN